MMFHLYSKYMYIIFDSECTLQIVLNNYGDSNHIVVIYLDYLIQELQDHHFFIISYQ